MKINDAQKSAIDYLNSPLLVIAGAGSGKTLVITQKILSLIKVHGYAPSSILSITFTNKASQEMKSRVSQSLQDTDQSPYISTFHSFCADVLRHHFSAIDGPNQFMVIDGADRLKLIKDFSEKVDINDKTYPPPKILSIIEQLKNNLVSSEQALQNPRKYEIIEKISLIYDLYQRYLWERNMIDFSDMLYFTYRIFEQCPDVLKSYQNRFQYVLVDEYQDTNHVQYRLIHSLVNQHRNLTVVGDFDQNIYSWRGASLQNILNFEKDFPGAHTIYLEQNYRSTKTILKAANQLISHNVDRKEKNLFSTLDDGDKITYYKGFNEHDEVKFVCHRIDGLINKGILLDDICILYRINALSRVLEDALTKHKISYKLIGGLSFFERKEIKDILHYLRFIHNPKDITSFNRISNYPSRDIGASTQAKAVSVSTQHQCSILDILKISPDTFSTRATKALQAFFDLISDCQNMLSTCKSDGISKLILHIIKVTGYEDMLKKSGLQQDRERLENIYELLGFARQEELNLQDFINKISLQSDIHETDQASSHVTLMNIHHAKGLEFKAVFLVGFEEDILPHYRLTSSQEYLEEERRLCYVAITRCKSLLHLSSVEHRSLFGQVKTQQSSRFLAEIPQELLTYHESNLLQSSSQASESQFIKNHNDEFESGELISHHVWGKGQILKVDGQGPDTLLHIRFGSETKKLLAKYAPISKSTL